MRYKSSVSKIIHSKLYILHYLAVFVMFCMTPCILSAQSTTDKEYLNKPVKQHKIKEKNWKKAIEGIDYSKDIIEKKKNEDKIDPNFSLPKIDSSVFKIILILLVISFLVFIILKIFKGNIFRKNVKISNRSVFDVEDIDDIEDEGYGGELQQRLNQAISKKQYRIAVRLYYLIIIRNLSLSNHIQWKKDKTNNEYLSEMRKNEHYKIFRNITHIFERVWYGEQIVGDTEFRELSPKFEDYIKIIKN